MKDLREAWVNFKEFCSITRTLWVVFALTFLVWLMPEYSEMGFENELLGIQIAGTVLYIIGRFSVAFALGWLFGEWMSFKRDEQLEEEARKKLYAGEINF